MEKITVSTPDWVLHELMHVTCVEEYLALNKCQFYHSLYHCYSAAYVFPLSLTITSLFLRPPCGPLLTKQATVPPDFLFVSLNKANYEAPPGYKSKT